MAAGGGIKLQDIVGFELEVKIVAIFRLASDVEKVAGLRGQFSQVNPGHHACRGADSTMLSRHDVGCFSVEFKVAAIRRDDRRSGFGKDGRADCLVGGGAVLALSGGGVDPVEGDGVSGKDLGREAGLGLKCDAADSGDDSQCGDGCGADLRGDEHGEDAFLVRVLEGPA